LAKPLILIVDDEVDVVSLWERALLMEGFDVISSYDGISALDLAESEQPALILLDIMMRGVDGYTLATRLRGDPRTAAIPIIFMTGQEAPIYRTLSFGVGGVAHVQKPFSLTTLRAAIGQALGT
jgi:putative two-component system response regulator